MKREARRLVLLHWRRISADSLRHLRAIGPAADWMVHMLATDTLWQAQVSTCSTQVLATRCLTCLLPHWCVGRRASRVARRAGLAISCAASRTGASCSTASHTDPTSKPLLHQGFSRSVPMELRRSLRLEWMGWASISRGCLRWLYSEPAAGSQEQGEDPQPRTRAGWCLEHDLDW